MNYNIRSDMNKTNLPRVLRLSYMIMALLVSGCAVANVQDVSLVDSLASPAVVRENFSYYQGRMVQWGGVIVGISRGPSVTSLDILSYPLQNNGNPDERHTATGRFLIELPPSTATGSYQSGRYVSVVGTIKNEVISRIGQAEQRLPVLVDAHIHLWDRNRREEQRVRPVLGFGVGVRF